MSRRSPILSRVLRVLADLDWEDSVPARWAAQMAVGAIPGLIVVFTIMHLAGTAPRTTKGGTSAASIVPLLSASTLVDTAAFHRIPGVDAEMVGKVQYRAPSADRRSGSAKRVLSVTKRTSPLPVNFKAPRTEWNHLDAAARQAVDLGLAAQSRWKRVVLHGSGSSNGSVHLIERYQTRIRGLGDGQGYDFVIGNGSGAKDGSVRAASSWSSRKAGDDDLAINVCLVGDFQSAIPTHAQLEALDELIDYLSVKLGSLTVTTHDALKGEPSRCLGARFPTEQVLKSLAE